MPISHGWTTTQPDDPSKDVSERNLNDHVVTSYLDVTPDSAVPPAPAAGWREFYVDYGVSPNRRIYRGVILANGQEVPIYDFLI